MKVHALIDGDWVLYAAGFAGQKTKYVLPALFGEQEFDNKTELREAAEQEDDDWQELPVYSRVVLDPESHFYHSAKKMIETQLEKVSEKFGGVDVSYTVLIDGDGNFRNRIATLRSYKGNRAPNSKPEMYGAIRQYLIDQWGAEVVYDQETDDEMCIRATKILRKGGTPVLVGVDKDYKQQPGWWLQPNKGFMKIGEQQGAWYLHVQCLTGDSADNIGGAYKIGPKIAQELVPKGGSPRQMWDAVVGGFKLSMDKYPEKYPADMTPEEAALENMRLVYLRREYNETWQPPLEDE